MKINLDCMECNIKLLIKVSKLLQVSIQKQEEASSKVFQLLSTFTFDMSNTFIMGEIWKIIIDVFNNPNPYKDIKFFYNKALLQEYSYIKSIITNSIDPFETALKISVVGNIIDFGSDQVFSKEGVLNSIANYQNLAFQIDDSDKLETAILQSNSLLYIGDNCGEIVLDKLFIETIKMINPNLKVYFAVRGGPIMNDVTLEDAGQVKMEDVSRVISTGAAIPGTVLEYSTKEFQNIFNSADVIIAKGQGNFESLCDVKQKNLYLILIPKCVYVANTIGVSVLDKVIIQNIKKT